MSTIRKNDSLNCAHTIMPPILTNIFVSVPLDDCPLWLSELDWTVWPCVITLQTQVFPLRS